MFIDLISLSGSVYFVHFKHIQSFTLFLFIYYCITNQAALGNLVKPLWNFVFTIYVLVKSQLNIYPRSVLKITTMMHYTNLTTP